MTDIKTYPPQQSRNGWPVNPPYSPPAQPSTPPGRTPPGQAPPDQLSGGTGAGRTRGRRWMGVAALAAVLVLGGGAAGGVIGTQLDHDSTATAAGTAGAAGDARTISSDDLADVVAKVSPSIVDVKAATGQGTAEGSGIVLTSDGRVVTNNHVVEGAAGSDTMRVTLADGRSVPATVVGTDTRADIAVLQMRDASDLTPATLGDSSSLRVGDTVLAFGSPLGLQGTVTSGIVSALDRSLNAGSESLSGLLQTDAAINHGNSGGALVDTAGRVVGVNVAIATTGQDTGNIGVGFAIPINTVKSVVDQIVR